MIETRRREYLEALGFDVWVARPPAGQTSQVGVGSGRGSTLLICASADDCETKLAADLARALGGDPVWAWLDIPAGESSKPLDDIISDRLITRVLLFGPEPGRSLFQGPTPEVIGSATVVVVPGLPELEVSGVARQALWKKMRDLSVAAGTGVSV